MNIIVRSVFLFALVVITTQDITGRKGCDCSICKGVNNKLNPIVGKKVGDDDGGKSSCNICERRKELLRMEREKQRQLQKCPFEILGAPAMKGKTSEEIFDEFREAIVPSQNGFFDMMRGVVRTMHGSSVTELKWAKEKEARELAKKRKEEAEEAKKRKEEAEKAKKRREFASESPKEELLGLENPIPPKVTVVLKQTPCGQIIQTNEQNAPEKISLMKRHPESDRNFEDEVLDLQPMYYSNPQQNEADNSDLNQNINFLSPDLIEQLLHYKTQTTAVEDETTESTIEPDYEMLTYEEDLSESTTESPYVKFVSNDEMKAYLGGENSFDDFQTDFDMSPTNVGVELQGLDRQDTQNGDYVM